MMQSTSKITQLNEKYPNCIFAECSFDGQVVSQVTAVAVLHHQVYIMLRLFAVEQRHHIFMVQLGELLEYFDFFAEKILRLRQALLGDTFYGHG